MVNMLRKIESAMIKQVAPWRVSYALWATGVLWILLFVFFVNVVRWVSSDVLVYSQILEGFLNRGRFPVPPGFPLLLWLFSAFSKDYRVMLLAGSMIMAIFTVVRIFVVYRLLQNNAKLSVSLPGLSPWLVLLFVLGLNVAAPLMLVPGVFYIGRITANLWHSPTFIAMMPFALLLFWYTPSFVANPKAYFLKILFLAAINLLFKPSYLFAWLPALGLFALIQKIGYVRDLMRIAGVGILVGAGIFIQYGLVYHQGILDEVIYSEYGPSRVAVGWLEVWYEFLKIGRIGFWQSMLASFAFPLVFLLCFWRTGFVSKHTVFSVLGVLIGLWVGFLFKEDGPRMLHGNFLWTAHAANFMLFFSSSSDFLGVLKARGLLSWRQLAVGLVFLAHVLSGLGYLFSLMINSTFV